MDHNFCSSSFLHSSSSISPFPFAKKSPYFWISFILLFICVLGFSYKRNDAIFKFLFLIYLTFWSQSTSIFPQMTHLSWGILFWIMQNHQGQIHFINCNILSGDVTMEHLLETGAPWTEVWLWLFLFVCLFDGSFWLLLLLVCILLCWPGWL